MGDCCEWVLCVFVSMMVRGSESRVVLVCVERLHSVTTLSSLCARYLRCPLCVVSSVLTHGEGGDCWNI